MTSPSIPSARQLWSLPPHRFNEWRATNDVPRLFAHLRKMLPEFGKWFDALPFEPSVAARIVPTGELFKGTEKKRLVRRVISSLQRSTYLCRPVAAMDEPPARFAAGADAVQTFEAKAATLLAQANALRALSSSFDHTSS